MTEADGLDGVRGRLAGMAGELQEMVAHLTPDARVKAEAKVRVKALLQGFDQRTAIFGAHAKLFGDPAWIILLELFLAGCEGRSASVSDISVGSRASSSTGLRQIAYLEQRGLVSRTPDPADRRRHFLALSPDARSMIARWLERT